MRTKIIESDFSKTSVDFDLYKEGLKHLGKIRLEFDSEMREFYEKRKADYNLNGEKSQLLGQSYDKPFRPNLENTYTQNFKEYSQDKPFALEKAFIQYEIERIESIKRTIKDYLKDDFESPEMDTIDAYIDFLNVKEAGKQKKSFAGNDEKYKDYYPVLTKIYELCVNDKSQKPVFDCKLIEFLEAIETSNFTNINIKVIYKMQHLTYKLSNLLGEAWYSDVTQNMNWNKKRCSGLTHESLYLFQTKLDRILPPLGKE
ncbi:MAG: hypothetical protein FD155_554 [Bacteroidetes bacterium]|nr:MAG: hypothetical protein FD155_554 [Bacteroidota bacterium]